MRAVVRMRWLTIAIALVSALAFAMSVQGGRWWTIGDAAEVGPFGAKRCFDGDCVPAGMQWLGASDRWVRFGMATWAAGLLCAAMLVVLAAALAAKRIPRLVAKSTAVALGTAMIVGAVFAAQYPGADLAESSFGRGTYFYAVAIVLGAVATVTVLRRAKSP